MNVSSETQIPFRRSTRGSLFDESVYLSFPLLELLVCPASEREVLVIIIALPPNLKRIRACTKVY